MKGNICPLLQVVESSDLNIYYISVKKRATWAILYRNHLRPCHDIPKKGSEIRVGFSLTSENHFPIKHFFQLKTVEKRCENFPGLINVSEFYNFV